MAYTKQTWVNGSGGGTPLSATRLQHIEDGLEAAAEAADDAGGGDIAGSTHAATGKSTPVDADELPIVDSAASNVLKKLTWVNVKATLKTYFDGLYLNQNTTGSAAKLTTPRTINSVSFDGSANITVADATKVPTTRTVNGHALSTDVTVTSTDVLPSQTSNNGKFLTTNGSAASWGTPAGGGGGDLDVVVVEDGDETRPSGPLVVLWVDTREDASRPDNMGDDDLWFTPNEVAGGGGDMLASVYDPTSIADDAFDRANHTGTQAPSTITGLTATAAELNALDGITSTVTELNFTDGVTSAIQTQLNGKQALDTDLTTIAGLTATTDNVIQSVGSAWASRTPAQLKATLALAKADVSLGNVDNTSNATERAATRTLTNARITSRIGTTASSATPTADADAHDQFNVTALAAGATFGAPTGTPTDGQKILYRVKDNGTARSLAFNAIFRALGVTLPTTTVISKTLYIGTIFNGADTKWDVLAVAVEA